MDRFGGGKIGRWKKWEVGRLGGRKMTRMASFTLGRDGTRRYLAVESDHLCTPIIS